MGKKERKLAAWIFTTFKEGGGRNKEFTPLLLCAV